MVGNEIQTTFVSTWFNPHRSEAPYGASDSSGLNSYVYSRIKTHS